MNLQSLGVTQEQASAALREYKQHRNVYDKHDWEIERIYRAIAKGKTVISVQDAIVAGGVDEQKRPRLAICRADSELCICRSERGSQLVFAPGARLRGAIRIEWAGYPSNSWYWIEARLPRIPPQYRPPANLLGNYHLLWEAEWNNVPPRDPCLLRRIGKDAWIVLAAWDLTAVEMAVLRAYQR